VHGKPRQALEVNQDVDTKVVFSWKDDLITRLENGRKRVADAQAGPEDT
jgi:hypothetical protein